MRRKGHLSSAAPDPAEVRKLLESFFAELHQLDHPCSEWKARVLCYVRSETEATVKQLLHELRQIETRLLLNMHKLEKSDFFRHSEPAEGREFAYQKWIHGLIEAIEEEQKAERQRLAALVEESKQSGRRLCLRADLAVEPAVTQTMLTV